MTEEVWKAISGYEGRYEVSDLGRVRSLPRTWTDVKGRHGNRKGDMLKMPPSDWGYPQVKLYDGNGRGVTHKVAHLVIYEFVGPRPVGMEVCHDDGDPGNSRLDNLRYDTPVGNQADRVRHNTHIRGERHPRAKLSEDDVLYMRKMKGIVPQWALALEFDVSSSRVSVIMNGKSWRHLNAS